LNIQPNSSAESSFGKRLRQERERRRITLDSIAGNTKINITLLKGLERDDVSRWPSGIFRRSFIREYANAIGLNAEEITREFLNRFPDPDEAAPAAPAPPKAPEPPTLRLKLDDGAKWTLEGSLLGESWRRAAAFACDLAVCLLVAGLFFLVLGLWWKPLALMTLMYYGASVLLLGNAPGVFLFGQRPTRDELRGGSTPSALLHMAVSRVRREFRFGRLAALRRRLGKRILKGREHPRSPSTIPFSRKTPVSSDKAEERRRALEKLVTDSTAARSNNRRSRH
jgi:transcriptional regulator with XRE-family HTH domain